MPNTATRSARRWCMHTRAVRISRKTSSRPSTTASSTSRRRPSATSRPTCSRIRIRTSPAAISAASSEDPLGAGKPLYTRNVNDRFILSAVKAVEDVNALDPQPDFVLFGGDLAQLGRREELDLGAQILKDLKAPVKMMVGEHDWFYDLGDTWKDMFGPPTYSFDWKGVHVVVLMSVYEKDFWTARQLSPAGQSGR